MLTHPDSMFREARIRHQDALREATRDAGRRDGSARPRLATFLPFGIGG